MTILIDNYPGVPGLDALWGFAAVFQMPRLTVLFDTGSDAPGTLLVGCSADFRRRFEQAPLIVAKGQANYETLSASTAPVFFLLQAKCSVIARDLGVTTGSIVVKAPVFGDQLV